ncbi:MAG: hypothetical protein AAF614_23135 [Chloroflexota bacterium]
MFFLVSGAAASGKSTLAKNLSAYSEALVCHDADERVMKDADTRCQQLEEWVQLALRHQHDGCDFLLTTHSPLGELLACPSAIKLSGIAACLLDCRDTIRIQRMRDRGFDPEWPPSQHVLNWASWHRMHAWEPRWEQNVITESGTTEHDHSRWTAWQQADERWDVNVIDTTAIDAEGVASAVAAWVKVQKEKLTLLTSDSKWWEQGSGQMRR